MATAGDRRGGGPERAFHAQAIAPGDDATLAAEESRHLVRVRRVRVGEPVVLFDGRGGTWRGSLVVADARGAQIRVEEPYPDREPPQPVTLAVSLPDGGRTDDLVSVLAELGVWCLVPLLGERTPPGRGDMVARRMERWTRLVREAAKVNGRSRLLRIAEPMALREVLAEGPAVMLDPDPEAPTLASRLPASGPLPSLLVGPEGGFTPREVEAAAEAGAERARLGRPALRTATAAIAAAVLALARE